jgi:hypothetical protein
MMIKRGADTATLSVRINKTSRRVDTFAVKV